MRRRQWSAILGALVMVTLSACGGGGDADTGAATPDTTAAAVPPPVQAPPAATAGTPPQGATAAMVTEGQQIFSTVCYTCHGADAKGTPLAPNLTDAEWINNDGTYAAIIKTVTDGVPQPKNAPGPMMPKGGANLTDDQVKAVSAYVWSLGGGK